MSYNFLERATIKLCLFGILLLCALLSLYGCGGAVVSPRAVEPPCGSVLDIQPGTLIVFGDSITCRWPADLLPTGTSNAGIDGNTTAQMMERLGHDVLVNHPPILVILGGVNDIIAGVPVDTIAANLFAMANTAR